MKTPIGLKLDPELVERMDKVRDGSRTRFIEEAVLKELAQREATAVETPVGNNPQSAPPVFPTNKRTPGTGPVSIAAGRAAAHHPTCHCAICSPPKAAA